jgi:hypothetical protein
LQYRTSHDEVERGKRGRAACFDRSFTTSRLGETETSLLRVTQRKRTFVGLEGTGRSRKRRIICCILLTRFTF